MTDTAAHAEKETLSVEVNIPQHAERGSASALFVRTRKLLIEREGDRCFICGATEHESGHPLEAHHHPIERCVAELIDWPRFIADAKAGHWGPHVQAFAWDEFDPANPYTFVDDMTANGLLIDKGHHIGKDEGIHTMPFPLWIAQKYARDGYQFSPAEIIHHFDGASE